MKRSMTAAQERLDLALHDGPLGEAHDSPGHEHADDLVHEVEGDGEDGDADQRPDQGAAEAGPQVGAALRARDGRGDDVVHPAPPVLVDRVALAR